MGLRPGEARDRYPRVITFAELEEFADMPIANYSSGMQVRLAFATSFQVDADVLLFDEVMAVGDALFQRKCRHAFETLIAKGRTIIYVSHSLETVSEFADRALLLERGQPVKLGEPEMVIEEYERLNRERARRRPPEAEEEQISSPEDELRRLTAREIEGTRRRRLQRFVDVVLILARTDFKLRYLDSAVGYVWALMQPLLMFAVLYVVWTKVLHRGGHVPNYGLNLLLGLALFTFFTEATSHALPCLITRGTVLRKIPFSPLALPLASVLNSSFVYGLSMVIVFGFILASGISPDLAWLLMVPLWLFLVAFTAGACMLLSLIYVLVRDVQQIWLVVVRLLFFVTPVFYPIEVAPAEFQQVLMINPLAVVIVEGRHVLIDPSAPGAAAAAGGGAFLAVPLAITGALLATGIWQYQVRARRLAERS
jgi:ABC-2 type transport system permease protein